MKATGKYKKTTTKDRKCVKVHRLLIEKLLGIILPRTVDIHHIDGNKGNNSNNNLVVCSNRSYHKLLHKRQEVLDAGFSPKTHHKCTDCNSFKIMSEFSLNKTRTSGYNNLCKICDNIRHKERYSRRTLFAPF